MTQVINAQISLMAVGILQPTTPAEVVGLLNKMLPEAGAKPTPEIILSFLKTREKLGHVIRIARYENESDLYSLTLAGHRYLTVAQRKLRDKFRFYLLRSAHRRRFLASGGEAQRLVGDSLIPDNGTPVKGSVANKLGQRVPSGQVYWPRISRQFDTTTGSPASPSGPFPEWMSFSTQRQCETAAGFPADTFEFDYEGLAACLGVSPKIISQIANAPDRHYREFQLGKRSGGYRTIESPRVFLKVIQWYLADYVFAHFPVHPSVHSFRGCLETRFWGGWPGSDVIPNGCRSQFGEPHVDPDHPAAA